MSTETFRTVPETQQWLRAHLEQRRNCAAAS